MIIESDESRAWRQAFEAERDRKRRLFLLKQLGKQRARQMQQTEKMLDVAPRWEPEPRCSACPARRRNIVLRDGLCARHSLAAKRKVA